MRTIPKLAQAHVEITARTGKYKASIADVKRQTNNFGKSASKSLRNVTLALTAMGVAATIAAVAIATKLTKAIIRAGKSVIKSAVDYDKLQIGLKAVAGSSEEAARQLVRLAEVAKLPGLSFRGAIAGSTALQAAGLSAGLAERSLLAFGNALVTVGKGADDLKGVNLALQQILTKGTGFGQELRQLSERLPQVRKAMKDAFGIGSVEDFKKLGLSAEQFIEGIVIEFEKLPKVSGTVANALENLDIAFDRFKAEIGKTLMGLTTDTSKALAGVIDTLREILPHWKLYQDQIGTVFGNIIVIAFRSTGHMLKSMGKLMIAGAPLVWKPLWLAFRNVGLDIDAISARIGANILKAFGIIDQATFDADMKALAERNRKLAMKMGADFGISFDKSFAAFMIKAEKESHVFSKTLIDGLKGFEAELSKLKATIPAAIVEPAKKAGIELRKISKETAEAMKAILDVQAEDPQERIKQFRESQKRILDFNETVNKEMRKRQETNLANFREFLDESRQIAQDAADAIRPAFENLFAGLISGNTKSLWAQFWDDLKRIAISRLASIFAGQLLGGIFGGGGGIGGLLAGGSLLAGLGPIAPAAIGAAGVLGPLLGRAGGFLEGNQGNSNTFIFNETDFANMDRNRVQKTVSQTIAPALAEDALDGR